MFSRFFPWRRAKTEVFETNKVFPMSRMPKAVKDAAARLLYKRTYGGAYLFVLSQTVESMRANADKVDVLRFFQPVKERSKGYEEFCGADYDEAKCRQDLIVVTEWLYDNGATLHEAVLVRLDDTVTGMMHIFGKDRGIVFLDTVLEEEFDEDERGEARAMLGLQNKTVFKDSVKLGVVNFERKCRGV